MNSKLADQNLFCVSPPDFQPGRGWEKPAVAEEQSRWCCEQLEEGHIVFFGAPLVEITKEDREFLLAQRLGDSKIHKNISYRPGQDLLRGFPAPDPEVQKKMHEFMRRFSQGITKALSQLLSPYAAQWSLDYASYRPEAEESRNLPVRKRNDLLHVDAFPSRPTSGGRILRCFVNINPTQSRIWQTTDGFAVLAQNHARQAGLKPLAERGTPPLEALAQAFKKALGLQTKTASTYDRFMLRFHDYLKENAEFQRECPKIRLEFPPNSCWLCFTDAVPHSVISGQFALEQTFIVPISAMVAPERSPLRVLEGLVGRPLISSNPSAPSQSRTT
jgi:hypothetical protein